MNKKSLTVGVIVSIIILIGILAVLPSFEKHSVSSPSNTQSLVSLPFTTTINNSSITSSQSSTTTITSTTSTTSTPNKPQPNALYLLNYTNGTYWFIAVLNTTLPGTPAEIIPGSINNNPVYAYQIHEYRLYGYTELVFPLNSTSELMMTKNSVYLIVSLSNGEVENFQLTYAGNWTFGSI